MNGGKIRGKTKYTEAKRGKSRPNEANNGCKYPCTLIHIRIVESEDGIASTFGQEKKA
jgi:hypothetical protein